MTRHRTALLVFLAAVHVHSVVERPAECPQASWDTACQGKMTCAVLAEYDVYCSGLSTFGDDCVSKCAAPCCITTTSTTITMTETTVTSVTVTATTVTETVVTHTATVTSATETTTVSNTTHTETTTATHTATGTTTGTATLTSSTATSMTTATTTVTTNASENTTNDTVSEVPSVVIRVPLEVDVNDPDAYLSHSSVPNAYAAAFAEASGINASYIGAEMQATGEHSASLVLVITIPASQDGEVLVPVISMDKVQNMIHSVDVAAYSKKVSEKVDEEFGAGTYTQKVLGGDGGKSHSDDHDAVAYAPSSCRMPAAVLMVLMSWLC